MNVEKLKEKSIWILICIGTLVAIIAALESRWEWLANLCGGLSSGCREVRDFTFLTLPIAYWGIAFYLLAALSNRFAKAAMFWIVMAAMGAELTLLWIMYSLKMPCLFCLLNAVVMILLFICLFNKRKIWQTLIVCIISFFVFGFLMTRENRRAVETATAAVNGSSADPGKAELSEDKIDIDIENSPSSGPEDAAVTIVEFSDYMCPSCRELHPIAGKIRQHYQNKVKWVFKDFPLRQHRGADRLAEAARCAWDQDKFWEFQDELFSVATPVDFAILPAIAQALKLDMPRFIECVDSRKYMLEVIKDRQDALNNGINSTPSLFLNGRKMLHSRTEEALKMLIDEELKKNGGK